MKEDSAVKSLTEKTGGHGFSAILQEHLGLFIGALDAVEKHFAGDSATDNCCRGGHANPDALRYTPPPLISLPFE